MRPQIVKILTLILLVFNSISMLAQNAGPPHPSQRRPPDLPAPIDDNVLVLIMIGLFYGIYIAYKKYQAKNTPA